MVFPVTCNLSPVTSHEVLDYLEKLRECSLVLSVEREGEMRFRMLDTLREYAEEKLGEYGDVGTWVRRSHAEYFLRHGMTITVIPYRRWQWTALYKEATEKFASQVRLRSTDATCRAARWLRFGIAGYGNLYYPFWGDHGNLQDLRRARCAPREYGPRQASLEVRGVARGIGTATQGQSRQGRRQSV